jgi:acetyl-CoA carboxylase biotin carboxylase subunit
MEMNTRLQVEHPVTEMISGLDLVEEQIRIAALEPLRFAQRDVALGGHAIEMRINAEDPEEGFRPDPGTIVAFEPPRGEGVRWDSAVRAGWRIPPHYDSMIGKLVVHAPDRPTAIARARAALATLRIEGVKTTIPLHRRILEAPDFVSGRYDIGFLAREGRG